MELKEFIKSYNELKRHKEIVANIDKDYFFDFVDTLLQALENSIPKEVIKEKRNNFIEQSKNEKVFMTQSSQINASLIRFCKELLEGK